MQLTSPAFANGGQIPRRYTCDGDDVSPPLQWSEAPAQTRSFALICRDPDAPSGMWYHWAAFDIAPDSVALPEHCPARCETMRQARTDFGKTGYGGPCPPQSHGRHHYHFTLYALDADRLAVAAGADCRAVETALGNHILATAELVGLYAR